MKTRLIRLAAPLVLVVLGGCTSQLGGVGAMAPDRSTATVCGDRLGLNMYARASAQRPDIQEAALARADAPVR